MVERVTFEVRSLNYLIWGAGELARTMNYYLKEQNSGKHRLNFSGLVSDPEYFPKKMPDWVGRETLFDFNQIGTIMNTFQGGIYLPIGYNNLNSLREKKFNESVAKGLTPLTFIHNEAYVAKDTEIGRGSIILEHTRIQTGAKAGKGCYFWSSFHLGHNSVCEDFVFASTGSVVSGNCKIGHNSFLGIGSLIKDGVEITPFTTLGAGAIITKNTKEYGVYLAGANNYYKDVRE